MPKKKFEEMPYDPIAADLMREVALGSKGSAPSMALAPCPPPATQSRAALVEAPRVVLTPTPMTGAPEPVAAEPTITKRFVLTRSENEELEGFLLRLQKAAGVKVTLNMFTRAVLNVAMQAEEFVVGEVREGAPRRFPSTHDNIAQGAFEEWWMRCLSNALRRGSRATASLRSI